MRGVGQRVKPFILRTYEVQITRDAAQIYAARFQSNSQIISLTLLGHNTLSKVVSNSVMTVSKLIKIEFLFVGRKF